MHASAASAQSPGIAGPVGCISVTGAFPRSSVGVTPALLLELGAHPRAKTNKGNTTLHCLILSNAAQTAIIQRLRDAPLRHRPLTESLIDVLLQHQPPLEEVNQDGQTPLMLAAFGEEHLLVTKLISHGASIQRTDQSGATGLHFAALKAKGPEMITMLIKGGALVDANDSRWRTPLHYASRNETDAVKAMECLLQAGADKEAKTLIGTTPLQMAASNGRARCVELLLSSGANIEHDNGTTALHDAVSIGHLQVVKILLGHGANPLARSALGTGGTTPRSTPIEKGEATVEQKQEIRNVLKAAEKEWKLSGRKYAKWRWTILKYKLTD